MAAYDLITLADLKAYAPISGTGKDAVLRQHITSASRMIESEVGRRLIYRAPPETENANNIVASRTLADETIPGGSITAPNSAGRTLIVTLTDADASVSAGTVTVTGTVAGVAGSTEVFDFAHARPNSSGVSVFHGVKFFTAISSIVVAATGEGASDTLKIGASLGYVEYHTRRPQDTYNLWSLEWPFRQVLEVNEDANRSYPTSTQLIADTDYILSVHDGKIVRIASSLQSSWATGWRATKLVHSAGYTYATVPEEIKDICRRLTTLIYKEVQQDRLGISGASDATGNFTRFGAAKLTGEMREQLAEYRRTRFGAETGERDFDLEAA